jgi:hypothetical protein
MASSAASPSSIRQNTSESSTPDQPERPVSAPRTPGHWHRFGGLTATIAIALVVASFPILSLWYVRSYSTNVPYGEQLRYLEFIRYWYDVGFPWQALTTPFQNHLMPVSNAVVLMLAALSHWDVTWESYATWAFLVVQGACTLLLVRELFPDRPRAVQLLMGLPLVWLIFSVRQIEIWLFGLQLLGAISVAAASATFWLFARPPSRRTEALSIVTALISSFSFASGFLLWPVGLLVLALLRKRASRARFAIVWTVVGAAAWTVYLLARGPDLSWRPPGRDPLAIGQAVLVLIGAPVATDVQTATAIGGVLLVMMLSVGFVLLPRTLRGEPHAVIPLSMVVYGLLLAASVASARNTGDASVGLNTRYLYLTQFAIAGLWLALLATSGRWVLIPLYACLVVGLASATWYGLSVGPKWKTSRDFEAYLIRTYRQQSNEMIANHFGPLVERRRDVFATMERLGIGAFANGCPQASSQRNERTAAGVQINGGDVPPSGAVVPRSVQTIYVLAPAPCVSSAALLIDGSRLVAMNIARPNDPAGLMVATFDASLLKPGTHSLRITSGAGRGEEPQLGRPFTLIVKP